MSASKHPHKRPQTKQVRSLCIVPFISPHPPLILPSPPPTIRKLIIPIPPGAPHKSALCHGVMFLLIHTMIAAPEEHIRKTALQQVESQVRRDLDQTIDQNVRRLRIWLVRPVYGTLAQTEQRAGRQGQELAQAITHVT